MGDRRVIYMYTYIYTLQRTNPPGDGRVRPLSTSDEDAAKRQKLGVQ
jgi:hypothetical protein